jgi:hypothetical protein
MRDNTDDQLRVGGLSGAMTGLFPAGTDLKREEMKLMRQQVAGFYDPHDKVMVEVQGMSVLGNSLVGREQFANELLQAHELTHALQDQHFGLDPMLARVRQNDDEEIALHSVIEGDATLTGIGYVSGGLTEKNEKAIISHFAAIPENFEPESGGTPLALSLPLMFQYTQGTRFVAEAWRRGGWASVDALYQDPPKSSQQIIDPTLYFDHRTPPLAITIDGYQQILGDWKKVDDDTFGELLIKVILERNLPVNSPLPKELPPLWRGDHVVALENNHSLTLLWLLAFGDASAAQQFAVSYGAILNNLKGEHDRHYVEARDALVLVIIGPGASESGRLAPALWKASVVGPG